MLLPYRAPLFKERRGGQHHCEAKMRLNHLTLRSAEVVAACQKIALQDEPAPRVAHFNLFDVEDGRNCAGSNTPLDPSAVAINLKKPDCLDHVLAMAEPTATPSIMMS